MQPKEYYDDTGFDLDDDMDYSLFFKSSPNNIHATQKRQSPVQYEEILSAQQTNLSGDSVTTRTNNSIAVAGKICEIIKYIDAARSTLLSIVDNKKAGYNSFATPLLKLSLTSIKNLKSLLKMEQKTINNASSSTIHHLPPLLEQTIVDQIFDATTSISNLLIDCPHYSPKELQIDVNNTYHQLNKVSKSLKTYTTPNTDNETNEDSALKRRKLS